jgi:hypothetical protein
LIRPVHAALRAADRLDEMAHRRTFAHVARALALDVHGVEAVEIAEAAGAPREVVSILKAAVGGSTLGAHADDIGYAPAARAFSATLSNVGVFDWLLASMQPGALHTRYGVAVSHLAARGVDDGAGTPVTKFNFDQQSLASRRCAALVVLSKDLLRHARGVDVIENALRLGVVRSTDTNFLEDVSAGASSGSNSGSTAAAVLADLLAAVLTLAPGTESALHVVLAPDVCRRLAFMSIADNATSPPTSTGARAFPEMTVNGGVLCGLPARASDEAVDDVTIIDAAGYVGAAEDVQLRRSDQASIEMVTTPTLDASPPVPASVVSMFQTNSVAIMGERRFGFDAMRTAAVKIASVTWGE